MCKPQSSDYTRFRLILSTIRSVLSGFQCVLKYPLPLPHLLILRPYVVVLVDHHRRDVTPLTDYVHRYTGRQKPRDVAPPEYLKFVSCPGYWLSWSEPSFYRREKRRSRWGGGQDKIAFDYDGIRASDGTVLGELSEVI